MLISDYFLADMMKGRPFFIWPILEASAEILQKIWFTFWDMINCELQINAKVASFLVIHI